MSDEATAATDETLPLPSEAEALASLREYALGPIGAVFTWSEAGVILELIETLTKSGIIEVAIRNPSVAEYMAHWEGTCRASGGRTEPHSLPRHYRSVTTRTVAPLCPHVPHLRRLTILYAADCNSASKARTAVAIGSGTKVTAP
jgi:hypothetical protein